MTMASQRLQPWATRLFVQRIIQTNNKATQKLRTTDFLWEPPATDGFSSQMNHNWYHDS